MKAKTANVCLHCKRQFTYRPTRGLCSLCYERPEICGQYPMLVNRRVVVEERDVLVAGIPLKEIPFAPGHKASADGRIWSQWDVTGQRLLPGMIREQRLYGTGTGYLRAALRMPGGSRSFRVSRLVLETFVGACPDGMESCHNDGNKVNNCLSNLRWDTHVNNIADIRKHGRRNGRKSKRTHGAAVHRDS